MTECKKKRKTYMRAIVFELDCGHEEEIVTCYRRLSADRVNRILDGKRDGIFCLECCECHKPIKALRTQRF